jgi:Xaa-Pro aminopeptidase
MSSFAHLKMNKGPKIARSEYRARIDEFWSKMRDNSVAIVVANPERTRSNDTEHGYRQSSDLLYLTGFPEADAVVAITKLSGKYKKRVIMFVRPKDRAREIWTGIRCGVEGAKKKFGAHEAYASDAFGSEIGKLLARAENVYYHLGINEEFDESFKKLWQTGEHGTQMPLFDPLEVLHDMRTCKSAREQNVLRHSAEISARGHCAAMQATRPGMSERQLQAVLEGAFMYMGAEEVAYGSIVAGGNNAVVLHYTENKATLKDGDLVLVDAAAEFAGYASDITRTWPVSGKFTEPQREIYELVLKSQLAAIKAIRPGVDWGHAHNVASRVLRAGLIELGILPADMTKAKERELRKQMARDAKAGKKPAEGEAKPLMLGNFFMHGVGHHMGIDVHDPCDREELKKGMVLTVEPGLYFDKDDTRVPEKYRGIGVRIEDDVIVTDDGCEVITASVPKSVADIEKLMSGK